MRRRVAALAAQIRPAAVEAEHPLLSEAELKAFVESGYLVVQSDFPAEWHDEIGALAEATVRAHAAADPPITGSEHQDGIWGPLTPQMQAVITCPALQAALTSILGDDFVVGGGAHMHVSTPEGQQYHKDGTPVAIKAHEPRGVIMMYYPNGASVEMGPTAVCPGSMYFGRDMRGAPDLSEQHDVHDTADEDHGDPATRAIAAIGLPRDSQRIISVPPGSILVAHEHLFHRGTASSQGSRFRPAFKMSARRVSEPRPRDPQRTTRPEFQNEEAPFGYTGAPAATQVIYEASWAWLCGGRQSGGSVPHVSVCEAANTLRTSSSEVERTGAAYCLARTECGVAGADALLASAASIDGGLIGTPRSVNDEDSAPECVRRAAFYGLRAVLTGSSSAAARARVTASLVPMLREEFDANEGAVCGTAAVLFVLAAASPVTRPHDIQLDIESKSELGSTLSDELVLSAIVEWIDRTRSELGVGMMHEEGHNVPQPVEDRRRAMVEACYALARTAMSALHCGKTESVLLAAERLLQMATDGGMTGGERLSAIDGGSGGNKSHAKSVAHSAATALLQLCSCPVPGTARPNSSSMYGGKMGWPVGWQGNDASVVTAPETVGEGLRRLRKLSRDGMAHPQQMPVGVDNAVGTICRSRRKLLAWLEVQCAARGAQWCGMGKWAYIDCHAKAQELCHA